MKYKFLIILFILILLVGLINFTKENFDNLNENQKIMTNKVYFNHFNKLDFKLRDLDNINDVNKIYKEGIEKILSNEEKMLKIMIDDFKRLLNGKFKKIFSDIHIIKVKNHIENSLPHTRQNKIVLSQSWFDIYSNKFINNKHFLENDIYLQKLIAHEQFHIFQRLNPLLINKLYKNYWNLEKYEQQLPQEILKINRTNPDALPNENWLFKLDTNKFLLPLCVYDPNPNTISDTSNIYIIVEKKNNKFLINNLEKQIGMRNLLINNSQFKEYFGNEASNNYHPNELSSSIFEIIVRDQIIENKSKLVSERLHKNRFKAYTKMKLFLNDFNLI